MEVPKYITVLETMVKGLAKFPEDVLINSEADEMGIKLTINANKADIGAVIGREGNTIKAMRTVMRSVGANMQARLGVIVAGDRVQQDRPNSSYRPDMPRVNMDDEL